LHSVIAAVVRPRVPTNAARPASIGALEIHQPAFAGERNARLGSIRHFHHIHQPRPKREWIRDKSALCIQQHAPKPRRAQAKAALRQRDIHHILRHRRERERQPHRAEFDGFLNLADGANRAQPLKHLARPMQWPNPRPGAKKARGKIKLHQHHRGRDG
jgi:hypothetical protein